MIDAEPGPAIHWAAFLRCKDGVPASIHVQALREAPLRDDPPDSFLLTIWAVRRGPWGDGLTGDLAGGADG